MWWFIIVLLKWITEYFYIWVWQICAIYCDFRVYKLVSVDNPGLSNSSALLCMRYAKIKVLPFEEL